MSQEIMRPAIAMIELIFAIVIMGIVMMSAPMLLSTASKSGYASIQQEGINEAATQVNIIMSYEWDENNTQVEYDPVVLSTNNGDAGLSEVIGTNRRTGTPVESFRKYISSEGNATRASATAIGSEAGDLDDMDDFSGTSISLNPEETGGNADYIEKTTINILRTVSYMDDNVSIGNYGTSATLTFNPTFATATPTTNIKRIQVTLTSTSGIDELNKTIALHAFSSNIGSYKLEERP